ncbi:phytoene/squalene synthase family protein [Oryzibacter oryziterrae]|uniref:phytoene/squalene synthase family protein n=1 Tax=Oryzibacter oryziterrae TaxID=2766474 RepID=UPI001F1E3457|nr:phytoene/squalene synthase family protein [Oryzibacter oryziterrae]
MTSPSRLDDAYAHCGKLVEAQDRDRWLASLFLPEDKRRHVLAVLAFSAEVARVRESVHEPMPGEIRLQWWVDALEGEARGDVHAHPVAAAVIDTIRRFSLRRQTFVDLVAARRFDLYDDVMPTLNDLEGYAGETASALFQLAALILCEGNDPRSADAAGHAGAAYAMTGLMRALPIHARRNQVFIPNDVLARHGLVPEDIRNGVINVQVEKVLAEMRAHAAHHLDKARAAIGAIDPRAKPAFVGLSLVKPWLGQLSRAHPYGPPVDIASWRKPVLMWWWSRRR